MKRRSKLSRAERSRLSILASFAVLGLWAGQMWGAPSWLLYLPASLLAPLLLFALWLTPKASDAAKAWLGVAVVVWLGPGMGWKFSPLGSPPSPGERVRVISLNVASWNSNLEEVGLRTAQLRPDILLLQEMWWLRHLESFHQHLPEFAFQGDETGFSGTCIGTRFALKTSSVSFPDKVFGAVSTIAGQDVLLVSLHGQKTSSRWTNPSVAYARQTDQALRTVRSLDAVGLPVLLGADFNSTASGPLPRILGQRLVDQFSLGGTGYGLTFPSQFPLVELDRVMASPGLARIERVALVDVGSDHLAVVVDLVFTRAVRSAE